MLLQRRLMKMEISNDGVAGLGVESQGAMTPHLKSSKLHAVISLVAAQVPPILLQNLNSMHDVSRRSVGRAQLCCVSKGN